MTKANLIQQLLKKKKGIVTAKDFTDNNIAMQFVKNMVEKGELEKVGRGVYIHPDYMEDEYFTLQSIYSKAIFSNETALFLHDMSDRVPIVFDVTLPERYNASNIKATGKVKVFKANKEMYGEDITEVLSPYGKVLKVYSIERTICDIIKNKNKIDIQIFVDAIRMYARRKDKNLSYLNSIAKKLKIEDKVRMYLEILL